ncbi:hypothetical protein [Thalassobacillus sp. CUG 92003]|uniref:hypothetical protein n=1 Tax=Thalassobacillus sp. CUG 92003 TaxID=2736641 RepID=UPI0015E6F182|nr:hypothetical protein [Thalassobacillus sp. CUG 92003]
MSDILELLFGNFLIVAAIIGGILSWMKGMGGKQAQDDETKRKSGEQTRPVSPQPPAHEYKEEGAREDDRVKQYYDHKQERLNDLSKEAGSTREASYQGKHDALPENQDLQVYVSEENTDDLPNISINKGYFSKKKLAEGMIMAEILGPPRAYRRHRTYEQQKR